MKSPKLLEFEGKRDYGPPVHCGRGIANFKVVTDKQMLNGYTNIAIGPCATNNSVLEAVALSPRRLEQ